MNEVDEFVEKLDSQKKKLVEKLRRIVKENLPQAEEKIKWGNPTYILNGQNLTWILIYKDHVDLGFFHGSKLKSPFLEGTGKGLRHIKVRSEEDIEEEEFKKLLEETATLSK